MMQDQVGVAVEQTFARAGDGLEMQMQARGGAGREETGQQAQRLLQRAEVADHDAQLALFAHRQLGRVRAQAVQFAQQCLRTAVE